jgi:hypothetical protein
MTLESGNAYVRRIRLLRARRDDPLQARLMTERLLATATFRSTLPSDAILCIRKLADPAPGKMVGSRWASMVDREWQRAMDESLRKTASFAKRPATDAWTGEANAVWFADLAELLACLARDWCQDDAHGRWWWQLLFPALDLSSAVDKTWIENPQHVPTALRRLDEANCACEFLAALPRRSASRILESVLTVFGLDGFFSESAVKQSRAPSAFDAAVSASKPTPAPWLSWAKVDALLRAEPRQLLVIALMLERAPAVLRSPEFLRALRAWQPSADEPAVALAASVVASPRLNDDQPSASVAISAEHTSKCKSLEPGAVENADPIVTEQAGNLPSQRIPLRFQDSGDPVPNSETKLASRTPFRHISLAEPRQETVQSEWGGVFYLVNVALALELYGDFTRPRHAGLALPVWDFLTLLGQRMAGSESLADPLWPLLAGLSGRSELEPPACGFEPPAEWRMPADWLAGFEPGGAWCWATSGGRLRLGHPLGFPVIDVLLVGEAPILQLENELRRLRAHVKPELREDDNTTLHPIDEPLERWLAWLISFVHARLASALGVTDVAALIGLVFRHRAKVEVTAERVAVRFRLSEHPIELRMGGLDRDPGWVPAAGRRIAFHYD